MDIKEINKFKESVLNILKSNPNGVYQKVFYEEIPNIKPEQLLHVINELSKTAEVESVTHKNNKSVFFRLKTSDISKLENKLSEDEKYANKFIREGGSKGIAFSLLKKKINKTNAEVLKIEKRLSDIGLIKIFSFSSQKVYVAVDIVPDSSLSEKLFVMKDKNSCEEKIADLQKHILDFLEERYNSAVEKNKSVIDYENVANTSLKTIMISIQKNYEDKISEKEIKLILDSLVYSRSIIKCKGLSVIKNESSNNITEDVYRFKSKQIEKIQSVACLPCILCPYKEICTPGKEISPENCKYLDNFLELF